MPHRSHLGGQIRIVGEGAAAANGQSDNDLRANGSPVAARVGSARRNVTLARVRTDSERRASAALLT